MGKPSQTVAVLLLLPVALVSCQSAPQVVEGAATSKVAASPTLRPHTSIPPTTVPAAGTAVPRLSPTPSPVPSLMPFVVDLSAPFARSAPVAWTPEAYAGPAIRLPVDLARVINPHVIDGLTAQQQTFLAQNGFVVIRSQEAQFNDIRYGTAYALGQPFLRTTDEAYHALHLLFDDLLKALELQVLRTKMTGLLQATLQEVQSMASASAGTSLEQDVQLAEAYLGVALRLLNPSVAMPQDVEDQVVRQVAQIEAGAGRAASVLFPDFEDDYGAYKPVGHYAGIPELEQYFRAMSWLGRVHFALGDPDNASYQPSRVPLIITLALRRAQVHGEPASESWGEIHRILDFLIGPTDDAGPLEFAQLMDRVYGPAPTSADLADEVRWDEFLSSASGLPAPQINSTFVDWTREMAVIKGWRFMGQRFTLDANVFQNLIFDKVGLNNDDRTRDFPTGLDVMAVLGSEAALRELERLGETQYLNYEANLIGLKEAARSQPAEQWFGRFYSAWLYSFFPVLETKLEVYPPFMQTEAWAFKDVNTALGSWAELKHDTVLYTKMSEGAGGGGPPMSGPATSYVEPNPTAFFRMAYAARAIADGLEERLEGETVSPSSSDYLSASLDTYLYEMSDLAKQLDELGLLAIGEIEGQGLDPERAWRITACLGLHECVYTDTGYNRPQGEMPEVPIVAAVSGAGDSVLEVGTGYVDRIYVVVPLEGGLEIAQGGVYSYFEFIQPRSDRLTDEEWRSRLDAGAAPARPAWASRFSLAGGTSTEWLFFRVGDTYIVTEAGNDLNLRESPSASSTILGKLQPGSYLTISDGPVHSGGFTWWKVGCEWCSFEEETDVGQGWVAESQEWLERSYAP